MLFLAVSFDAFARLCTVVCRLEFFFEFRTHLQATNKLSCGLHCRFNVTVCLSVCLSIYILFVCLCLRNTCWSMDNIHYRSFSFFLAIKSLLSRSKFCTQLIIVWMCVSEIVLFTHSLCLCLCLCFPFWLILSSFSNLLYFNEFVCFSSYNLYPWYSYQYFFYFISFFPHSSLHYVILHLRFCIEMARGWFVLICAWGACKLLFYSLHNFTFTQTIQPWIYTYWFGCLTAVDIFCL